MAAANLSHIQIGIYIYLLFIKTNNNKTKLLAKQFGLSNTLQWVSVLICSMGALLLYST